MLWLLFLIVVFYVGIEAYFLYTYGKPWHILFVNNNNTFLITYLNIVMFFIDFILLSVLLIGFSYYGIDTKMTKTALVLVLLSVFLFS